MASRRSNNTLLIIVTVMVVCCANAALCVTFNATVTQDGSADFKTVSEAVSVAPRNSMARYSIRVKPGRYFERVVIDSDITNLSLIGDDPKTTTIVFNRSNSTGFGTNDTASLSKSTIYFSIICCVRFLCCFSFPFVGLWIYALKA